MSYTLLHFCVGHLIIVGVETCFLSLLVFCSCFDLKKRLVVVLTATTLPAQPATVWLPLAKRIRLNVTCSRSCRRSSTSCLRLGLNASHTRPSGRSRRSFGFDWSVKSLWGNKASQGRVSFLVHGRQKHEWAQQPVNTTTSGRSWSFQVCLWTE